MTTLYIDVSHHDRNRRGGPLDWQAIKAETSPAMCARATYGDPSGWHRDSPYFGEFQSGARDAGFVARGAYHNLIHGDGASIGRQVDWLRATRDKHGANWVMADVEPYAELVSADLWPRWDDVRRFHDVWYQRETAPMVWYIPRWYWADRGGLPSLVQPDLRYLRGPLIQSHYAGGDGSATQVYANAGGDSGTGWDDGYGGRLPDVWQFTSDGDVPGASDHTDVNAFRGTYEQLRALLTGDDMDANEQRLLSNAETYLWKITTGEDPITGIRDHNGNLIEEGLPNVPLRAARAAQAAAEQALAKAEELAARPPVQAAPLDPAAFKAALLDPQVLAAIAKAVTDEIGS